MKTNHASLALLRATVLIALVFHAAVSWAADTPNGNPPENMTYQGFVADGNGDPLGNTNTGPKNYDVIFRIYNAATAGTKLWGEQQTVTIDKGYFSVLLGEGAPYQMEPHVALSTLFTNVANASDRYIEITVKGIGPGVPAQDVTILPRLRLLTSPYAFLARTAVGAQNIVNGVNSTILSVNGTNVGINKIAPTSALDVNGTVTAGTVSAATVSATSAARVSALTVTNAATVSGGLTANTVTSTGIATVNGALTANSLTVNNTATVNGALTANTFSGNGANVTSLNANNLLSGTVADTRLSANVPKLNASQTYTGTNTLTGTLFFTPVIRQMLNLFNASYGIGVQDYTLYQRSDRNFAWFKAGQHTNTALNPGPGGTCMMVLSNGFLGIGTTTPTAALDVFGGVKISTMPILGNEYNVQWDGSSHNLGRYSSSRRYKENIQPMEADWAALLSAQPVTFTYIGRPDRLAFGFIAEDLDALGLKPLVIYDEAGRPDSVRYEKVSLYLLQIVKAQQEELKEKSTRLQALEQSVSELKALVNSLAEKVNASGK